MSVIVRVVDVVVLLHLSIIVSMRIVRIGIAIVVVLIIVLLIPV